MSTGAIVGIAVAALVVLAAVIVITTARRADTRRGEGVLSRETRSRDAEARDREPVAVGAAPTAREVEASARSTEIVKAQPLAPAPYVPPDPETVGVTRRQFFNRSMTLLMTAGLAGFGAAVLGFLWSAPKGGFGGKINAGKIDDLKAAIKANKNFYYVPEARSWLVEYPANALPKASTVYSGSVLSGMEQGLVALYQKCPHLGCRVPECATSQWFECPCHGSQYNRVGEKKAGPAPRGMDRFGIQVTGSGDVIIDTGLVVQGPAIGVNTTGQEAEGPHCITGGGGH